MAGIGKRDVQFDAIVNEVVSEAHLSRSLLLPEEIEYIREHALNKPLGVIHIWALGVGVVITGMYFGWNFGLPVGGPIGVLVASLIVCVLYLAWVLALSELSVAMPFAGGPLAFGRRAVGKWFGFLMGWSMFLECLFATIGTGLAAGGYIAFLVNPEHPDRRVTTACAILCALVFLAIQYSGVKQQAVIMLWLTYAAIAALVWFWLGAAPGVSLGRVFTRPLLPSGWSGVLGAVPYALWWLVIIETVALAAEEAHEPHVSIPRGLVLAQITLVALVLLTWWFASAAAPYAETGAVDYPLPLVFKKVWGTGWFLTAFSAVAVAGMVVSYNGMIYATSRQSFSLGRAGYLPKWSGRGTSNAPNAARFAGCLDRGDDPVHPVRPFLRESHGGRYPDLHAHGGDLVCAGHGLPDDPAPEGAGAVPAVQSSRVPVAAGVRGGLSGDCGMSVCMVERAGDPSDGGALRSRGGLVRAPGTQKGAARSAGGSGGAHSRGVANRAGAQSRRAEASGFIAHATAPILMPADPLYHAANADGTRTDRRARARGRHPIAGLDDSAGSRRGARRIFRGHRGQRPSRCCGDFCLCWSARSD